MNDEGKKVKVTRKIKRTLTKTSVNHVVAERMGWAKSVTELFPSPLPRTDVIDSTADRFGQEKGAAPGPHAATTTVGENVRLRIQAGGIKVSSLVTLHVLVSRLM